MSEKTCKEKMFMKTKTVCFKRAPIKLNPKISDKIYEVTAKLDNFRIDPEDIFDEASIMLKTAEHEIECLRKVISNLEGTLKDIQNSNMGWSDARLYNQIEQTLKQKVDKQ